MASAIPPFPSFNVDDDPTTTGQRWTKWKKRFENFLLAMDIDDPTRKRALLLHYIGPSAFDVFETLSDTGDEKDYKTAMERLTEHFTPQRNVEYEIYLFRQARQQPQETLDQFATRLRQLASSCEFASVDKEIKWQIILSCSSSRLRRRALREPTITLKALLDLGRAMELSETQASGIESQSSTPFDEVNYTRASQRSPAREPISRSSTCENCGNAYPHPQGQLSCPARGAECRACRKLNHFARVCRSKPISTPSSDHRPPRRSLSRETPPTNPVNSRSQRRIRHVDSQQVPSSDSDDEYLFTLTISQVRDVSTPKAKVMVADVPLQVLIDNGASINVIDEKTYHTIIKSRQNKRNHSVTQQQRFTAMVAPNPYLFSAHSPLTLSRNGNSLQQLFTSFEENMDAW